MKKELKTRQQILRAAQQVVVEQGANALTLEAVARAADVSKGGLLYHFPTKEALISGMIDELCVVFEAALAETAAEDKGEAGRFTRAYLRATFATDREAQVVGAALFAAVANNFELVAPFRSRMRQWQAQIEQDGLDPALATAIRLAADGLWFADLGDFAAPQGEQRGQVLQRLIKLTEGA